ncbi:PEP-CTERM sorting domain-containing protein [Rhodopila sp.]|uniref:PEP-CTERM sorting domain-containing protein n=1 Tax=Rhodopila sp. TaxID=2480087 RepID=UPI003D103F43
MSRNFKSFLLASAALTMVTTAALADPITYAGTFTIIDTTNSGALTVTSNTADFSVPLTLGQEVENITLATFHTTDNTRSFASYASDSIEGIFNFTAPVNESNTVKGTVTEITANLFGHFSSSGSLVWTSDALYVPFSDGSVLDIGLGSSLFANLNGTSDAQVVSANYTLTKEPIPEPATVALLGGGLLGLSMIRRRRRSESSTAA